MMTQRSHGGLTTMQRGVAARGYRGRGAFAEMGRQRRRDGGAEVVRGGVEI